MLFCLGVLSAIVSLAQEIRINAGFVEDSMEIGQEVNFWVTADYPMYLEVIFPDSLYSFAPFEYKSKYFQPTSETTGRLFDSAVYRLQSFEIDAFQSLLLNVVVLDQEDSLMVTSPRDSIAFKELIPVITDSTTLITNSSYLNVPLAFNYPLLWIIIGVLIFVAVFTLILFGKRIKTALIIRRLRKEYIKYNVRLSEFIQQLKENPETHTAELAIIDWKNFMEKLEQSPYSKLTTSEILSQSKNEELKETLRSIDRMVYGKKPSESIYKSFQSIEDFTQHRYQLRINELKDGRSNE